MEARPKILVVDDSLVELKIIRKRLGEQYQVLLAASGAEALELLKKETVDLILLDILMPEMDGISVCKILKADEATLDIPILFLTALADAQSIVEGFAAGGQDYITKPFQEDEFRARVKVHLELRQAKKQLERYAAELEEKNMFLQTLLDKMEKTVRTDYLTGLENRRSATKRLREELARMRRRGESGSLLLADIDSFKVINDTYGHEAGDVVLQLVSHRMETAVREEDIVARWGGEEFLILLPELSLPEALHVAERIRETISTEPVIYQGAKLEITVTLGAAALDVNLGMEESIKRADQALYEGKRQSKNCVAYCGAEGQCLVCREA